MSFRSVARSARSAAGSYLLHALHRRPALLGQKGPFISFTFDDFPRSAGTVGAAILERYGVRATFYVAMGLMGTTNELGELFEAEDLQSLARRGHELGNHSYSHRKCCEMTSASFQQDIERSKEAMREASGIVPSDNFAYPYGEVTLTTKETLRSSTSSCRTTNAGLLGPEVDLNFLSANRLYGDGPIDPVRRLIDENRLQKSWLIFYTHDISPTPSPFGCTPTFLENAVSIALESGAKVLPIGGVLRELATSS